MNILRVDTEVMATAAGRIGEAAERIDALLGSLTADVDDMLAAWSGPTANSHRNLHDRFRRDAVAINDSLREMQAALLRTHSTYVRQEGQQTTDHVAFQARISE